MTNNDPAAGVAQRVRRPLVSSCPCESRPASRQCVQPVDQADRSNHQSISTTALDTAQRRAGRGHASLMQPAKPRPGVPFVGLPLCTGPIRTTGALSGSVRRWIHQTSLALIEGCRRSDRRRGSDAAASHDGCNAPPIMSPCQGALWRDDELL